MQNQINRNRSNSSLANSVNLREFLLIVQSPEEAAKASTAGISNILPLDIESLTREDHLLQLKIRINQSDPFLHVIYLITNGTPEATNFAFRTFQAFSNYWPICWLRTSQEETWEQTLKRLPRGMFGKP